MGQSARAVLVVVCIVCFIMSIGAWGMPRPNTTLWVFRVGLTIAAILSVALFAREMTRADKAPNLLSQQVPKFFERDGFCFAVHLVVFDGICYFEMWFQNQYERASQALVVIRRGVSVVMTIPVDCEPAAFGRICMPYGVHASYQGTQRKFEIYAAVRYPEGRGKLLRFKNGLDVGRAKVRDWWTRSPDRTISFAGGVAFGHRAASSKLTLPSQVAETVPEDAPIYAETVWRLGDPEPAL